ncbi:MAG: sulfotransferase family protein [Bacteroidota bacterium]
MISQNIKILLSEINRIKDPFLIKEINDKIPALFILSTGRSGSTLLASVLNHHENIEAVHELHPYLYKLRKKIYEQELYKDEASIKLILSGNRLEKYIDANKKGKTLVDTSPFLSFSAITLSEFFPNSKFIFLHRTPYEFIRSGMRRGWYHSHPNDKYRLIPRKGTKECILWKDWSQFEKICWLWQEYNKTCISLFKKIPDTRKIILSSNELFTEPHKSFDKIFSLLQLPNLDDDLIKEKMKNPVNKQLNGTFPEKEKWDDFQKNKLTIIAGDIMEKLGYS